ALIVRQPNAGAPVAASCESCTSAAHASDSSFPTSRRSKIIHEGKKFVRSDFFELSREALALRRRRAAQPATSASRNRRSERRIKVRHYISRWCNGNNLIGLLKPAVRDRGFSYVPEDG